MDISIQAYCKSVLNTNNMITFIECQQPGYKARTLENAKADVTIAIALDFNTAGEILTRNSVNNGNKLYLPIPYNSLYIDASTHAIDADMDRVVLSNAVEKIRQLNKTNISINIAGNGIYSLDNSQRTVDLCVLTAIAMIQERLNKKNINIDIIRSGGQTGIDEAGLKAAVNLNIPALCLAPKGWLFRDYNHKDIADEQQFKARFN